MLHEGAIGTELLAERDDVATGLVSPAGSFASNRPMVRSRGSPAASRVQAFWPLDSMCFQVLLRPPSKALRRH